MFPSLFVKKEISYAMDYGIRDFEFTGGEPGEFGGLSEIVTETKYEGEKRGFVPRIAVISNGKIASEESRFWKNIDEVLVSYHSGRKPKDRKMFPGGSTWSKASACCHVARSFGKMVRTNSILGKFNIDEWDGIIEDIIEISPDIANILPVNTFDSARSMEKEIDPEKQRKVLKKAITAFEEHGIPTFVRYFPFCAMEGFERNIVGNLQHIWDWFDWNRELDGTRFLDLVKANRKLGKYGSRSLETVLSERGVIFFKSPRCVSCKFWPICDGFQSRSPEILDCCVPSPGKQITNPLEFIGRRSEEIYAARYGEKPVQG